MSRKDYRALPDEKLDRLKADLRPLLGTLGTMTLRAETLYWLVMEVIDSREEIFRLQLCETVDQIIARELEAGDLEHTEFTIKWPDDPFLLSEMDTPGYIHKPAFPCKDATERVVQGKRLGTSKDGGGRRMPRAEP